MKSGKFKVVVFGAYNAGKSTFIRSLDPESRHIDVPSESGTTTVAFDFGRVRIGDRLVYIFGTPGQERFEFVRRLLAKGMDAAVIVVDSTAEADAMTISLHRWLVGTGVPLAIILNKCDKSGVSPERFSDHLTGGPIFSVSALKGENVQDAFTTFIKSLPLCAGVR
jgi:uncharacterized protein